jgi:hypothetical protein
LGRNRRGDNPGRIRLGTLARTWFRLKAEIKQITHAIWMAAYNAQNRAGPRPRRPLLLRLPR